ncbi:hypothetical protein AMTR_s00045p00130710 [Amborella trichopoda]|uniref:Uncharacterized protein n=1 Tax=Amborella trichopoda TaxID=13333 RepID=W1P508_AMBTC|nr:hypothetical protein AMTR_s00045p00130710 [Amborella trichopoda]
MMLSATSAMVSSNSKPVSKSLNSKASSLKESFTSSSTFHFAHSLGIRPEAFCPSPEIGLCSVLFVLSVAMGAFLSVAIISLPAMNAFRRLSVSMDKLSNVVSKEVPGTLSSLKLSGLEINDLTQQLSNLRQRLSGNLFGKKERRNKARDISRRDNPMIN